MKKKHLEPLLLLFLIISLLLAFVCFSQMSDGIWPVTGAAFFSSLTLLCVGKLFRCFSSHQKQTKYLTERLIEYDRLATTGRMAAGIAHELNSPLAAIQQNCGWMADLVEDGLADNQCNFLELKNALKKTNSQITRAQATIRNVLDYVRNIPPDLRPIDLNRTLNSTVAFLEPAFKQNDIMCVCSLGQDLPLVFTHSETLQQILVNILANAIDAMCSGGKVEICTFTQNNQAQIQISDNGSGINPVQQQHLFEPFVTSKNEKKGTGLGLWICARLVEKIHGKILLHKSDQTGTTFVVTIPLVNQKL